MPRSYISVGPCGSCELEQKGAIAEFCEQFCQLIQERYRPPNVARGNIDDPFYITLRNIGDVDQILRDFHLWLRDWSEDSLHSLIAVGADTDPNDAAEIRRGTPPGRAAISVAIYESIPESSKTDYFQSNDGRNRYLRIPPDSPSCFVVSPISSPGSEIRRDSDWILSEFIKPACGENGFRPIRGEMGADAKVTDEIFNSLVSHEPVVAYLAGRDGVWNPNVMLEVGFRLATGKPVVILKDKNSPPPPFDLADFRYIDVPHRGEQSIEAERLAIIDKISQYMQSFPNRNQLAHPHAILTIDIKKDAPARATFFVDSCEANRLFRLKKEQGSPRSLSALYKWLRANLDEIQQEPFCQEQDCLFTELSKGNMVVATKPIVYRGHAGDVQPKLAHLPVIIEKMLLGDTIRVRVMYLDVTNATRLESGHYVCPLGLQLTERLMLLTAEIPPKSMSASDSEPIQVWDTYAKGYDEILPRLDFYKEVVSRHIDYLSAPEIKRVADLGAGTGSVTVPLLGLGKSVLAVDTSSEMLARLSRKVKRRSADLTTFERSIESLPEFASERYDAVTILLALFDVGDPQTALREGIRLLKPGGRLVITEPRTCFDLQVLLDAAERALKKDKKWLDIKPAWEIVKAANKSVDPKRQCDHRRGERLHAEGIAEFLRAEKFCEVTVVDSHLGQCATVCGRKPVA